MRAARKIWRVAGILLLGAATLLGLSLAAGILLEKQVVELLIRELNKQLAVPVQVHESDIHFSFLRDFPDASLSLHNLSIAESLPGSEDPFLKLERIALRFSPLALLRGNYRIHRIDLENGEIRLRRDARGKPNYLFWKTPEDSSGSALQVDLAYLRLSQIRFSYQDEQREVFLEAHLPGGHASGSLQGEALQIRLDLNAEKALLPLSGSTLALQEPFQIKGSLRKDAGTSTWYLEPLHLNWMGSRVQVNGSLSGGRSAALDLQLEASDLLLASLLNAAEQSGWLPGREANREQSSTWSGKGKLALSGTVSGPWGKAGKPAVELAFRLPSGNLRQQRTGLELDALSLSGAFRSQAGGQVELKTFSLRQGRDELSGQFDLANFRDPVLNLKAEGRIGMPTLLPFLPAELSNGSGLLLVEGLHIQGRLRKLREGSALPELGSGAVTLSGVGLDYRDRTFQMPSGRIELQGDRLLMKDLHVSGAGSSVVLDGEVLHGLSALLLPGNGSPIPQVQGSIRADALDLKALLELIRDSGSSASSAGGGRTTSSRHVRLPVLSGRLQTDVESFRYGELHLQDIHGEWRFSPGYWRAQNLEARAMDGRVSTDIALRQTPAKGLLLDLEGNISQVRIEECFRQFADFGQTELTHRHLKGRVSGQLRHVQVAWNAQGLFDPASVLVYCDLEVSNGELNGYGPVERLSRFIDLDELRNIRFSTLKNSIEIYNDQIHIPLMEVQSSALNLSLTGTHGFDGWLDYQVKLSLMELLGKKFSRKQPENLGFAEMEKSGGMAIYVSMKGMPDQLEMAYNNREIRQTFRQSGDRGGLFRREETPRRTDWQQQAEEPEFLDWDQPEP